MKNVDAMLSSRRCRARSRRTGKPCQGPAMKNGFCRMHFGNSPGGPSGEKHGRYIHGRRTKKAMATRKEVAAALAELKRLMKAAESE